MSTAEVMPIVDQLSFGGRTTPRIAARPSSRIERDIVVVVDRAATNGTVLVPGGERNQRPISCQQVTTSLRPLLLDDNDLYYQSLIPKYMGNWQQEFLTPPGLAYYDPTVSV